MMFVSTGYHPVDAMDYAVCRDFPVTPLEQKVL